MLLLQYLLMIAGWGLLGWAAAIALNNLNKVVQYHRQVAAPYSSGTGVPDARFARRGGGEPAGKTATELDNCQMGVPWGLAADHSRFGHCGSAQRDGRHQSEPDLRDPPRHSVSRYPLGSRRWWIP
jgi:hypothetical protein